MGYQDSSNRRCAFHSGNLNDDNYRNNKNNKKMWNKFHKCF